MHAHRCLILYTCNVNPLMLPAALGMGFIFWKLREYTVDRLCWTDLGLELLDFLHTSFLDSILS